MGRRVREGLIYIRPIPCRIVGHFRDSLRYSSERDVGTLAPHDEFLSMDERGTAHDRRPRGPKNHSFPLQQHQTKGGSRGRAGRSLSLTALRPFFPLGLSKSKFTLALVYYTILEVNQTTPRPSLAGTIYRTIVNACM